MSDSYGIGGAVGDLARASQVTGHLWGQVQGEWHDKQAARLEAECWIPLLKASGDLLGRIEMLQGEVSGILADLP